MRFAPKVQVLDAPAPLVVEQLVDVLALVEKKEREEDARMDQLEEMILTGQPVSVADKEAWRRRAKAGGPRPIRKKKKEKRKLPRTCLRTAALVPAVQARDHGGAPVPVHRPSASHSSCVQRQVRSVHTVQVCGDFKGAAFEQVVDVPVVVRQGSGLDAQTTVEVPQLQFLAKVVLVVVQRVQRQVCRTLFGSLQLQFLDKVIDVPVISTTRAHGGPDTVLGQGC